MAENEFNKAGSPADIDATGGAKPAAATAPVDPAPVAPAGEAAMPPAVAAATAAPTRAKRGRKPAVATSAKAIAVGTSEPVVLAAPEIVAEPKDAAPVVQPVLPAPVVPEPVKAPVTTEAQGPEAVDTPPAEPAEPRQPLGTAVKRPVPKALPGKAALTKPGVAKPGLAKPGVAKPGLAKPGLAKPVAAKPVPAKSVAKPLPAKAALGVRKPAVTRPAAPMTSPVVKAASKTALSATAKTTTNPLPQGRTQKDFIMDMTSTYANGFQGVIADAQSKSKAALEKSTAMLGEVNEFTRGNVEAVVESGKILAAGLQDLGTNLVAESRTAFETMTADLKELAGAKTPADYLKLQSEIARKNFDSAVAYGSKNSEAVLKLANDVLAPLSGRVSLAVEKAKSPLASVDA